MRIAVTYIPNTRRLVGAIKRNWDYTAHTFTDTIILIDVTDFPF